MKSRSIEVEHPLPGKVERVAVGDHLDDLAINWNSFISGRFDIGIKDAEGGVVLEEVRSLLDAARIVDGNDIKWGILATMPAPQEIPANPSKPIDGYLKLCFHNPFLIPSATSHLQEFKMDVGKAYEEPLV